MNPTRAPSRTVAMERAGQSVVRRTCASVVSRRRL